MIVVKAWGLPKSLYGIIERMDGLGSFGDSFFRFRLLTPGRHSIWKSNPCLRLIVSGVGFVSKKSGNESWAEAAVGPGWLEFIAIWRVCMDLWEEGSREGGFRQLEDGSGGGGGVPAPVFMGVRLFVGTTEGGMGCRPPSSRGRISTRGRRWGRATRFLDSAALCSE